MSTTSTPSCDLNCDCPRHSINNLSKPWTRPLKLDLLSSSSVQNYISEISTSEKCERHRQFVGLPPTRHARKASASSLDHDAQFRRVRSNFDEGADLEELEYSPELPELVRERAKTVDDFAKKNHESTLKFSRRKTSIPTSHRDTSSTLHRSKSFMQSLSCGVRSFLPRRFRPRVNDDDIPVRLNRLHGADESSMSVLAPAIRREFMKMSNLSNRPRQALWRKDIRGEDERCENESTYGPTRHRDRPDLLKRRNSDDDESPLFALRAGNTENSQGCRTSDERMYCYFENESGDQRDRRVAGKSRRTNAEEDCKKPFRSYNPLVGPAPFDPNISDSDSDMSSWNMMQDSKKKESPVRVPDLIQYYNAADSARDGERNRRSYASLKMRSSLDYENVRALFECNEDSITEVRSGKKWVGQRAVTPIYQVSSMRDCASKSEDEAGKIDISECGAHIKAVRMTEVSPTSDEDHLVETLALTKDLTAGGSRTSLYRPTGANESDGLHKRPECGELFLSPIAPDASSSMTLSTYSEISPSRTVYDAATLEEGDAVVRNEGEMSGAKWSTGKAEWDMGIPGHGNERWQTGRTSMEGLFDLTEPPPRSKQENNEAWHTRTRLRPIEAERRRKEMNVKEEKGRKLKGGNVRMGVGRAKSLLMGSDCKQKHGDGRRKTAAGIKRDRKMFVGKTRW